MEFIQDFKIYLRDNKDRFKDIEIFLLRNFPKSGVGFFNLSGFYPDFIMWLKIGEKQTMIFIDPKGLQYTKRLDDQKVKLSEDITDLESVLGRKDITLESVILSQTTHDKLVEGRTNPEPKEEYINKHVLFLEDKEWPKQFFEMLFKL